MNCLKDFVRNPKVECLQGELLAGRPVELTSEIYLLSVTILESRALYSETIELFGWQDLLLLSYIARSGPVGGARD